MASSGGVDHGKVRASYLNCAVVQAALRVSALTDRP